MFLSLRCRSSQVWISSGQTWNFSKSSLIVLLLMCCIAQVRGWLGQGEWGMLSVQGCGVAAFSLVFVHRQWIWGPFVGVV